MERQLKVVADVAGYWNRVRAVDVRTHTMTAVGDGATRAVPVTTGAPAWAPGTPAPGSRSRRATAAATGTSAGTTGGRAAPGVNAHV
ncbi:hypothetical protein [Streptomyces chiangmaiensis]|uniref:Uncharacterized protein n=1 Tax=Streptomyces chiangmaiensis TaxID=766497 RepID=A0ABU7FMP3_9ACTN|nr:hypothetical protein [Streptomyces chiangmaiensis]MED7825386.1 hypothetical protein [Streptomyces chiangmaiensis]